MISQNHYIINNIRNFLRSFPDLQYIIQVRKVNRGYAEESSSSTPIPHLIFKIWNQLLFKNNCLSPPGIQLKFRLHIILIQLIEICKIHIQISRLLQSELLPILQCLLSRPKATLQLSSVFTCPIVVVEGHIPRAPRLILVCCHTTAPFPYAILSRKS